jgi:hypothetical protein
MLIGETSQMNTKNNSPRFSDVLTEDRMKSIAVRIASLISRKDENGFYKFFDSLTDIERGYVKGLIDNLKNSSTLSKAKN